jgi:uncharacterized protein YecT (DUF1311 family)
MQIRTTRLGSIALGCLVAATLSCRPAPDTATPSVPNETASAPDAVASTPSQATEESAPAPSATEAAPDTAAVAPATPPPPLPEECNNPQTQLDMNRCTQAEYAQADAQLNQVYQRVKAEATGNAEAALVNAEKAWIEFRDRNCAFVQAPFEGGSIQPTVYYGCLTTTTLERVEVLRGQVSTALSYDAADAELNDTYQVLKGTLDGADVELLITAQLAWIDYRDRHCAYEADGSEACLAAITAARTQDLQNQLESRSL